MSWRGGRAVLVVAATVLAGLAPPVAAAPAGAEPRAVTARADCVPGGVVLMRTVAGVDTTHVTIEGRRVADGRWRGELLLEVGVDDTHDVALDVGAVDGAFRHEVDLPGTGRAAILDLHRGARACFASYHDNGPFTIAGGRHLSALVRHRGTRPLVARAGLDCRAGTRWSAALAVELADRVLTLRRRSVPCRHGRVEILWEREVTAPGHPVEPDGLRLDLRGPHGQTRWVRYAATGSAG
ncbi:MAG TPA: hypothetical protein VD864_02610 [Nocardioides sp.]|nr:hypothetical protein [Nocardioides sp.]